MLTQHLVDEPGHPTREALDRVLAFFAERLRLRRRRTRADGGRSRHQVSSYTLEQMGVWLELFYDLVFVAAILVFSSAVSHLHDASRITWVVAVFCAVWWVWLSTTMFTNRFHMADVVPPHARARCR